MTLGEHNALAPGDVVQLDPAAHVSPHTGIFAACFMLITDVKPWGAIGFISIPGVRGEIPGAAHYRASILEMEYIGKAVWVNSPGNVPDATT